MKNRLIITVTDEKSTKSYNVHQFIKKFFAIMVTFVMLIMGGSFWFISSLKDEIVDVKKEKEKELIALNLKKEKEFKTLENKEEELLSQNALYSRLIQNKTSDHSCRRCYNRWRQALCALQHAGPRWHHRCS